jgi:hypothetical protein
METISLCQPDEGKSCSACCGIYNYRHSGRLDLAQRLARRTERFAHVGRDPDSLRRFSQWVKEVEPCEKVFETIYNCEFVGFIDPSRRRVGCLLHPSVNGGMDLRGASFYGADMCAAHRCQSYEKLSVDEKYGVICAIDDWFLYGLCITDIDLVKGFFFHASSLLGRRPDPRLLASGASREALASFFALKVAWPFRSPDHDRFGKYCFVEDEYREARVPYEALGVGPSRYDAMLVSLASEFRSADELRQAEALLAAAIDRFVRAYQKCECGTRPASESRGRRMP